MQFWLVCVVLLSAGIASAAEGKKAYLDPKEAGTDFALQGEYSGDVTTENGKQKVGVQVIARGEGKFGAVGYHGGLPGDGWDGTERITGEGELKDGEVKFGGENVTAILKDDKITVRDPNNNVIGELAKVMRKSPTLEAKPPQGAIVLFDGTNTDQWQEGKIEEDHLLGVPARTKDSFGDFSLHLEFRTPFMPDAPAVAGPPGQARGNSGMYLHDQYEVQILDSFGLEGLDNQCGGIYLISKPKVNMCFPPLSWQTYDVEMKSAKVDDQGKVLEPARATVKHNGVVIHDNVELKVTPGGGRSNEPPGPGPLYLQDHGNPVRFRNIWLVKK
jgi:hypothetical protein